MTPSSSPFPSTPAANELPTPPRALLRGTLVERFEIVRVIADAASNLEYVAVDRSEPREVVLKEYMPQRLGRRKGNALRPLTPAAAVALSLGLRAFIDEGRLLASIDHPALVRVLGMIEANDTAYMVMPLYDGLRLLHARQAMRVPPDERLLRPLIDGLLSALHAMHRNDVLHGAVSPGNILLLSDERAMLLGPDLARHVIADDLVESLMTAVEPTFEAPEQITPSTSTPLGPWTDLYGLAETIRFCISGEPRPPHIAPGGRRETMAQMVKRLFGEPPTAVYSTALLETLDAALEVHAAARPHSTTRFRELLGALPYPAEPPPAPAPAPAAPEGSGPGRVEPAFDLTRERIAIHSAAHAPAPAPAVTPARPGRPVRRTRSKGIVAGVALCAAAALWGSWWYGERRAPVVLPASAAPSPDPATPSEPPAPVTALPPVAPPAPEPPAPSSAPVAGAADPVPAPVATPAPAAPVSPAVPERPRQPGLASPRDACDGRTQFALYRCMQLQCEQRVWAHHPQCELLRATDQVH